ncbi:MULTISPECIES: gas vesicle protein GvpG [Mesobacillus]|uniref:gas vesicle protein GvpG n=1 Tax=Mesobacillus TaxID=2675231 RepID=UPI001CF4CB54|nr:MULTISPECIES: gas vesicle protein GvpG [Mesobacillus]
MTPAYHPEWLVKFWLTTPGFNMVNPHYLLIVIAAVIGVVWFVQKRKAPSEKIISEEDQLFIHHLHRKKVIERELAVLEARLAEAEITEENFNKMKNEYQSHLAQVNKELKQYT